MRGPLPAPDAPVLSHCIQDIFRDRFKTYLFCRNSKDGFRILCIFYSEIIQFICVPDDLAVKKLSSLHFFWYLIEGMTGDGCPDNTVIPIFFYKTSDHTLFKKDIYSKLGMVKQVSRPEEPPLKSLSEPYVNLSAHTAPIIQPLAVSQISSVQTGSCHALLSLRASVPPFV